MAPHYNNYSNNNNEDIKPASASTESQSPINKLVHNSTTSTSSTMMTPRRSTAPSHGMSSTHNMGSASHYEADDLSIVASEEDGSHDDHSLSRSSKKSRPSAAPLDIVRQETKTVTALRYLLLTLFVISCVLIAVGTFIYIQNSESQDTESVSTNFQVFVEAFQRSLQANTASRLSSAFSISASYTSFALQAAEGSSVAAAQWPLITLPEFGPRTTGLLASSGTTRVVFAPLVEPFLKTEFQNYAVEQQELVCGAGSTSCPVISEITPDPEPNSQTSPIWQISPGYDTTERSQVLWDQFANSDISPSLQTMYNMQAAVFSPFSPNDTTDDATTTDTAAAYLLYPIFEDFKQVKVVASLSLELDWKSIVEQSLPFVFTDVTLVMEYSCSDSAESGYIFEVQEDGTLQATALTATINPTNNEQIISIPTSYIYGNFDIDFSDAADTQESCSYTMRIIPGTNVDIIGGASGGDDGGGSSQAIALTVTVVVIFGILLGVFVAYDWFVEKRQRVVVNIATKSSAIVDNLFPAQVRDRMLQNMADESGNGTNNANNSSKVAVPEQSNSQYNGDTLTPMEKSSHQPTTASSTNKKSASTQPNTPVSVKQFLSDMPVTSTDMSSQPIADLFPNTTVLFADIAGFTAWSSQREPPQVFTLLETLYRSFDVIAGKLKVFKVETIGDCYMAVTGLPNPDDGHAVHMSRFAYQCLLGMKELIKELEAILGPGTSDLALRVGLHSGPVTAGVLRGEKSRFQLFGDTVNTASRMESTGERGRIQVSQETADLLLAAGKSHWLKPREEMVVAKGKGELKTYWLDPTKKRKATKPHRDIKVLPEIVVSNNVDGQAGGANHIPNNPNEVTFDDKYARLIDWNVDVLLHHLARVISCRSRVPSRGSLVNHSAEVALLPSAVNDVAEVVALPPFDADSSRFRRARPDVSMLQQTRADLHEYVKRIALRYRDVPFHNFEHASHVTLCANKLLNRLINSDEYETEEELHNSTFGISSDPLTHFAIVFAALIHDVDHYGLPNAQLVKDESDVAVKFDNKSVAEQNSVHIGWEMLMDPRFERLRKCIYQTNVERKRFRQLVINSVMATDIADRQVNDERQKKWDRAFRGGAPSSSRSSMNANGDMGNGGPVPSSLLQQQEDMNRKATAVIEHIIQVSDVAHTMQHWHIYRRWNERLFHEMHDAFKTGKVSVDPSTNWYIGELGFFDYYLIPLAMKLKECGVFGASGYEYISYVLKNKKEWERKGRQVVQEMVMMYKDFDEEDEEEEDDDSGDDSEGSEDMDDSDYDSPGDMSDSEEIGDEIGSDDDDDAEIDSMNPVHETKLGRS